MSTIERRQLAEGEPILVRDAGDRLLRKVAVSGPMAGSDFAVVWARWEESDEATPWPVEDVWFADGSPLYPHPSLGPVDPAVALTRAGYRRST